MRLWAAGRRLRQIENNARPVAARVRERRVGRAAAAEFGIHLNDDHQQKRRPALSGWKSPGVALGLAAGAQQGVASPWWKVMERSNM